MANDSTLVPFMRALDWQTLSDAGPVGSMVLSGSTPARRPRCMGTRQRPVSVHQPSSTTLSSWRCPAPTFPTNSAPSSGRLYAFEAATGKLAWQAQGLSPITSVFYGDILGPAVSSDLVVVGVGPQLYVFSFDPSIQVVATGEASAGRRRFVINVSGAGFIPGGKVLLEISDRPSGKPYLTVGVTADDLGNFDWADDKLTLSCGTTGVVTAVDSTGVSVTAQFEVYCP